MKLLRLLPSRPPPVPPGDISTRNRALVAMVPWRLCRITDLPWTHLRALAVHQKGPDRTPEEIIAELGERKVLGLAEIPMDLLRLQVMNDPDRRLDGFTYFEEYHEFFLSVEGKNTPRHPRRDRWPVILSGLLRDRDTIWDGWHRFHSYYRASAKSVPAMWYADEYPVVHTKRRQKKG